MKNTSKKTSYKKMCVKIILLRGKILTITTYGVENIFLSKL